MMLLKSAVALIAVVAITNVTCLKTTDELPFNCLGSPAATAPSAARQMCKNILDKGAQNDDEQQEDLVTGCACGLSTHNVWYKRLASLEVKQMAQVLEEILESFSKPSENGGNKLACSDNMVVAPSSLDKANQIKNEAKYFRENLKKLFITNLADIVVDSKSNKLFVDRRTRSRLEGADQTLEQFSRSTCQQLVAQEQYKKFLRPSLDAIKASKMGGDNIHRAVIVGQPELSSLVNLATFCESVFEIQA